MPEPGIFEMLVLSDGSRQFVGVELPRHALGVIGPGKAGGLMAVRCLAVRD